MRLSMLGCAVLLIASPCVAVADDLEDAFQALKEAESKKDAALVKKAAAHATSVARQVASEQAPSDAALKELWTKRIGFARDVEAYAEYTLYAAAVQAPPAVTVDLLAFLEDQSPKSKYLANAYGVYFTALNQMGGAAKVSAIAEKAIAHHPECEDLLMVLSDTAMNKQQTARAGVFAERLLAALAKSKKPEGVAQADWDRRQAIMRGRAHWIAGIAQSEKKEIFQSDKNLRAALPFVKGNEQMMAAALFHLGLVNYEIGRRMLNKARVLEAARFSDQAAAIKGPLAEQAWRNGGVMRAEAARMR